MSDRTNGANVEAMVDDWLKDDPVQETATDGEASEATDEGEGATPQPAEANAQEAKPPGEPDKPVSDTKPADKQASPAKSGDLVDRDGRVLARAGAERRHYEAASRFRSEAETAKQQLHRVTTELNAFREAAQMPTQLGLSPDESATGLQLMASWKQNPTGVIQYLVEQAKAAGHTVDHLGSATDVGAIKQIIAQEMQPLRQQAEQIQQQEQTTQAARQQLQQFVDSYGEQALVNGPALSKLMDASLERGTPLNIEQAYFRFTQWCQQQGYDPSMPIDPQIAGRANGHQQAPAIQQRPPRPNGRATPNGVIPLDTAAGITGAETTRDLVRAAMREQGFNV